jgi:transcriptional regulator with AAA-type ATPase domain
MISASMSVLPDSTAPWRPPWGPPTRSALRIADSRIVLIWGGRMIALSPGEHAFAGRGAGARLRGSDQSLSRRHARIDVEPGLIRVTDLESTNGVWLGAERPRVARVAPGEVVLIGRCPLLVARPAPGPAPEGTAIWGDTWFRSPKTVRLLAQTALAAQVDVPVWIRGPSGTGKEALALALHRAGPRASGPWVALNCAALPETLAEAELFGVVRGAFTGAEKDRKGAFERAHGGTLFLDEIGELSPALQAKLLRAVEDAEITPVGGSSPRPIDVRIVSATWVDLDREAAHGGFRFDLLQRISVLRLESKPLRSRPRDIGAIYGRFLHDLGGLTNPLDESLLADLEARVWPGNARGLRAHVLRGVLGGLDAPQTMSADSPQDLRQTALAAVERQAGNRSRAARALGVSRSTLYRWLSSDPGDAVSGLTPHKAGTHDEGPLATA